MGLRLKLKMRQAIGPELILRFDMDALPFEMVLRFTDEVSFLGLLDTPVGHVRFSGTRLRDRKRKRSAEHG